MFVVNFDGKWIKKNRMCREKLMKLGLIFWPAVEETSKPVEKMSVDG